MGNLHYQLSLQNQIIYVKVILTKISSPTTQWRFASQSISLSLMIIVFQSEVSSIKLILPLFHLQRLLPVTINTMWRIFDTFSKHSRSYKSYCKVYSIYSKSIALQLHIKIGCKIVLTWFKTIWGITLPTFCDTKMEL